MLGRQGVIPESDAKLIVEALGAILEDIEAGRAEFSEDAEDIHMNIERMLTERIGDAAKRLHTGRSRNDQVALDMRMFVMDEITLAQDALTKLMKTLLDLAERNIDTIMPGYTHLQPAQPVTFAHHMMAYFEMFRRDKDRLSNARDRADSMPLGSGALAAVPYPLDRDFTRKALGFSRLTRNSLDGVSDRDFCLDFLSAASVIMTHLSRFCEEIILWSSREFGFIELDDAYSTGSSIMPQKKNPDMAELIRGKTGRVFGNLTALLTVMKGLPLAYNKDMQEDKESVFDTTDTLKSCLSVFEAMIATMRVNKDGMSEAAKKGLMNATDAADWLVGRGAPFRSAHEIVGKLALYCVENDKTLEDLTIQEFRAFSDIFDDSVYEAITADRCVAARDIPGGPAPKQVSRAVAEGREYIRNQ
jgi:argininosuccinate lyase